MWGKMGWLELAKQRGNVSPSLQDVGYSRDSFYSFNRKGGDLAVQEIRSIAMATIASSISGSGAVLQHRLAPTITTAEILNDAVPEARHPAMPGAD